MARGRRGGRRADWMLLLVVALASTPAGAETVTLAQGDDVAPYQFLPATSRGEVITLWAFTDPAGEHSFETFLRFELPPDLLGPDEEVGTALLSLYFSLDSTPQGEGTDEPGVLECREALTAWAEMSVTWLARPSYGPPVDTVEGIEEIGPLLCDVTELVSDWAEGVRANHGFAVTNPTGRLMGFYSFEAQVEQQLKPALFIDVVPTPEPGAGAGVLVAAGALAALARRNKGAAA